MAPIMQDLKIAKAHCIEMKSQGRILQAAPRAPTKTKDGDKVINDKKATAIKKSSDLVDIVLDPAVVARLNTECKNLGEACDAGINPSMY